MFFQRVLGIALVCASPFLMAEDCEYSEWGRDDQIGAANRITPERTIAAASLVKTVLHCSLSMTLCCYSTTRRMTPSSAH
ncbi:hypothetical protein N9T52_00385 [bacterium]|nr:hypothetical protein [bacterium]